MYKLEIKNLTFHCPQVWKFTLKSSVGQALSCPFLSHTLSVVKDLVSCFTGRGWGKNTQKIGEFVYFGWTFGHEHSYMKPVGITSYFRKLSNLTALFYGLTKVDPEMLTLAEDPVPWKMRVDPLMPICKDNEICLVRHVITTRLEGGTSP